MNFPNFSFFYKVYFFYTHIRASFLFHHYFKLHNILFTNLYIRIYRNKLMQLDKRKSRKSYKKGKYIKQKNISSTFVFNNKIERNYIFSSYFFFENKKKDWVFNKNKTRKKKPYVYVNKFKDCGNQYNFDPFHPSSTYKLNEFNFLRTKKKQVKKIIDNTKKINILSSFDSRLKNINFKYFNNYVFSLLLDIYKTPNLEKKNFLFFLKNNIIFFYNLLLFLKKRIVQIKFFLLELRKILFSCINKLNIIFSFFCEEENYIFFNYIKKKHNTFFKYYNILNTFVLNKSIIYNRNSDVLSSYLQLFYSLKESFMKKYNYLKKKQQKKINLKEHFKKVNDYENMYISLTGTISKYLHFFKFFNTKNLTKWEKINIRSYIYINVGKYLTVFRSLFKYSFLQKNTMQKAIIYIKAAPTNVFLYFIYNNKILFKKSCGELPELKKKERRFWRNVFPLVETLLPVIIKLKQKYKFPYVSLYINGSGSLCSPLLSRMRKYNKKFRRLIFFIFNELDYFQDKSIELKNKFIASYEMYPIYRLKLFSILDGFNKLSKLYFSINKVKDITSWPFNGCKKKHTNVR